MKVGDLVELSAYGRKHGGHFKALEGKKGLVIDDHPGGYYWKVHWFDSPVRPYRLGRKELKHVKSKKTLDKTTSV